MKADGISAVVVASLLSGISMMGQAPATFRPTTTMKGETLGGWHALGAATWKVQNGEYVGTPGPDGAGGWLVLERGYQDLQYFGRFRCAPGCKTGVLLRAEQIPGGGMKGIFVSLSEGELGSYMLTLDARGRETAREPLAPGPGRAGGSGRQGQDPAGTLPSAGRGGAADPGARGAAPVPPGAAGRGGEGTPAGAQGRGGRAGRGPAVLRPGDWNTIEILIAADPQAVSPNDVLQANLNGGVIPVGAVATDTSGYGPVALYAGGSAPVTVKDVAFKDLHALTEPKEVVSANYTMQRISDFYFGWCAAIGDFNHDGVKDVESGPFYYPGPDYTERRRYREGRVYNASPEHAPDMISFAYDFTGDGWDDILSSDFAGGRPMDLYVNPKGESRRWNHTRVLPQIASELVLMKDIDGDGKPEVLFTGGGALRYARPDPADPTAPWPTITVSAPGDRVGNHGLGVGDVNGDKRNDIIVPTGWYEQPASGNTWVLHPDTFGSGGAEIAVYDVNGDGLNDLVTSLAAHGFGLSWFEQKKDSAAAISFIEHKVMGDFSEKNAGGVTFTEPHASTAADMDGDSIPDFVVGKRFWSHLENYNGPDPYGAAVLYVYRTVRNAKLPGGAELVPELVHNRSGVGSHMQIGDLNNDGAMDITSATNRGTFIFFGKPSAQKRRAQ